jgi:dihydroneopterin aldolase
MDTVFIENFAVSGKHGVYPQERRVEQEFIISLVLETDVSKARESDNVLDTVSYSDVKKIVTDTVKNNSFYLLEKLGHVIGKQILKQFDQVRTVAITLKKTAVWNDAVPGVTIHSRR